MTTNLNQLNKKDIQNFFEIINKQYDINLNIERKNISTLKFSKQFIKDNTLLNYKYFSIFSNNKDKYYVTNKEVENIDLRRLNLVNVGLYIGEMMKNYFRPSIEFAQIIAPYVNKNIIELNKKEAIDFLNGFDIFKEDFNGKIEEQNFIIIIYENDVLGIARKNEDRLLNFLSKGRRLQTSDVPDLE
ncbi:MAG: hypothetical protein PHT94_03165 [Candidatus Nanoarchaeia archaeon]|nr:hypothetical protein [Candidatus Nanoarchaeia archaeon]